MVCSLPGRTATSFARSIALPPPKPTTRSGCKRTASATAWSKLGNVRLGLHLAEDGHVTGQAEELHACRIERVRDDQDAPDAFLLRPASDHSEGARAELDRLRADNLNR